MKLFSEKVQHTITSSTQNILCVEDFNEIFFDVFEVLINKSKYPLEKIASYRGSPVVSVPVVIGEGEEQYFPFVLLKGKFEVFFNEKNTVAPQEEVPKQEYFDDEDFEEHFVLESKQEILDQIEEAKKNAIKVAKKVKKQQLDEAVKKIAVEKKSLKRMVESARESLVNEFISISGKIKEELADNNFHHYDEIKESLETKIQQLATDLNQSLTEDFSKSSSEFDSKIKTLIGELYKSKVIPKVDKELKEIATDIVEKVSQIEGKLDNKLKDKASLLTKEMEVIRDANIELNNNINKGVNKALSRVGNVKNIVESLSDDIDKRFRNTDEKIQLTEENIKSVYDEKLSLLREEHLDITDEIRKYYLDLISESRDNLVQEIRTIKNEKPVEYIIEKAGKKEVKDWDSIQKDINKRISDGISNEATRLRKYIAVYSGGGSVAQQFAAGGTINGDLIINGSISATTYIGVSGGGGGGGGTVATDLIKTTVIGDGITTIFPISGAPYLTNPAGLIVAIDGALQEPTVDYTVNNNVITFTAPVLEDAKAVIVPIITGSTGSTCLSGLTDILINNPQDGDKLIYNSLSAIWVNAPKPTRNVIIGDGLTTIYSLTGTGGVSNPDYLVVAIDGALQEPWEDYDVSNDILTFSLPVLSGARAIIRRFW